MKKTIYKWWWAWDFEKEEDWLNEMALSGWVLDGVGFCTYHFISCEPGEYMVRLEMHDYDQGYLDFMEETGAEYVGRYMKWLFFKKKTELGEFDIFSDLQSRIDHLKSIGNMLKAIGVANLVIGGVNSINPVSFYGSVNLLCATLLMYGLGRIHGKTEALEKEHLLIE